MPVPLTEARRLAGFELNSLRAANTLPADKFDNVRIPAAGTPIHDSNGELLFYRMPLTKGRERVAFADVAAHEALGHPLLAVSQGVDWDEKAILEEAAAAARKKQRSLKFDEVRFVAYSFPKIALQFLSEKKEVLMLEWKTWAEVPPATAREQRPPGNFERWSLLDEMPAAARRAAARRFEKRSAEWSLREFSRLDPAIIRASSFLEAVAIKLVDTHEVHYSPKSTDHVPCFELRGQETNVWCVGASVQMLLLFYRYNYSQTRLAAELGLGAVSDPNGLPYGDEQKVVDTLERLSSNALNATMIANPSWAAHYNDLKANRPMISFVPGHSRCVAGYTRNLLAAVGTTPFRGLLVYDPWPPNAGVITRWENFDAATYRYAFTASLKHV
jgi:hypothetical protein